MASTRCAQPLHRRRPHSFYTSPWKQFNKGHLGIQETEASAPAIQSLYTIHRLLIGAQEIIHRHWHRLTFHFITVPIDTSQQHGSIVIDTFHKKWFQSYQIGSAINNSSLVLDKTPGAKAYSHDNPPSKIDSVTTFVKFINLFHKTGRCLSCHLIETLILSEGIIDGLRGNILSARQKTKTSNPNN